MPRLTYPMLAAAIVGLSAGIASGGSPEAADPSASANDEYTFAFSVGCAPPDGRSVIYVWHQNVPSDVEGVRIFKQLAAPDFEDCLSEFARTRKGLYESLVDLRPQAGTDTIRERMREATEVWRRFGVYDAVREVAATGSRGAKVEALLRTCDGLRRKREATAPPR